MKKKISLILGLFLLTTICSKPSEAVFAAGNISSKTAVANPEPVFTHPGILHTREDLDRMKSKIKKFSQPWTDGYKVLIADPYSSSDYVLKGPLAVVDRGSTEVGNAALWGDGVAAYRNALLWYVEGSKAHRDKAIQILNAWAATNTKIIGKDRELACGIYGFQFANAAEIMAHSKSGWSDEDFGKFKTWMKTVFLPNMKADPNGVVPGDGNWGTCVIKTLMAIGVLCDDHELYNQGEEFFKSNKCAGVTGYILESGQCGESGRDQGHTQLGIGHLLDAAQIAQCQGEDLFSFANNRLLAGVEYSASYNLGNEVSWTNFGTCGVKPYTVISAKTRGNFRPIYEIAYAYEKAKGLNYPFTKQVRDSHVEATGFQADEPGFGTLTYYK